MHPAAGAAPWPNSAISPAEHLREVFYRQGFNDQVCGVVLSKDCSTRLP
jgi:hypothetical protein